MDRPYLTVDIERRGYGRRYTGFPVDSLSREGFSIDFNGQIHVPADGEYTFKFKSEGGYRFTANGQRLFESFAADGAPEEVLRDPVVIKNVIGE